jgi:hypothetical protein
LLCGQPLQLALHHGRPGHRRRQQAAHIGWLQGMSEGVVGPLGQLASHRRPVRTCLVQRIAAHALHGTSHVRLLSHRQVLRGCHCRTL